MWFAATFIAIAVIVALIGGFVWGLGRVLDLLSPILWPLAIAAIIAYLLDPVVDYLESRKMRRDRAIIVVFSVATLSVLALGAAIIPQVVAEARDLVVKVPTYANQIQERTAAWIENSRERFDFFERYLPKRSAPVPLPLDTNAPPIRAASTNAPSTNAPPATLPIEQPPEEAWERKVAAGAISWIARALPAVGSWLVDQMSRVAAWIGLLTGLALVPVYCFYFLKEKLGIQRNWTNYLPVHESRLKEEVVFIITSINNYLIVFFRGQVLVAACDAVLYTIGFFAVGLHYALLMGLLAGFLSIIPYLGAVLTIVPATILAAVHYRDWLHPLLVVGVFGLVQMLEGFVIAPRIIGDRVKLHPLTIIIAVVVGTTLLGGLLGGVLAIPLTAALRVLMDRYIWRRSQRAAMGL